MRDIVEAVFMEAMREMEYLHARRAGTPDQAIKLCFQVGLREHRTDPRRQLSVLVQEIVQQVDEQQGRIIR